MFIWFSELTGIVTSIRVKVAPAQKAQTLDFNRPAKGKMLSQVGYAPWDLLNTYKSLTLCHLNKCHSLALHWTVSSPPPSPVTQSICHITQWRTGTKCHQSVPPVCATGPWDLCAAAADRRSAVHRQPAPRVHAAAVRGAGAALRQPGALLPGVQRHHRAFQRLRFCGVHEEGLGGQGQVGAPGETAGLAHALRPLDWGGLPHVPAAALQMPVRGPSASEPADGPGPPQCPRWHPHTSLLPGQILQQITCKWMISEAFQWSYKAEIMNLKPGTFFVWFLCVTSY